MTHQEADRLAKQLARACPDLMAESTLTWHVGKGHVKPRKIAGALIFTRAQLDEFKQHPLFRQRRPRKPRDQQPG